MMRSLNSAVAGLRTHQTKMDVIGNNIANVNTAGFKASRVTFADIYYQTLTGASAPGGNRGGTNPTQIGYGSAVATIDILNTQTGGTSTDRAFDVYITGDGYLVTQDSTGNYLYTRLGNLKFDAAGNIVDSNGNFVLGIQDIGLSNTNGTVTSGALSNLTVDPALAAKLKSLQISADGKIVGVEPGDAVFDEADIAAITWLDGVRMTNNDDYAGAVSMSIGLQPNTPGSLPDWVSGIQTAGYASAMYANQTPTFYVNKSTGEVTVTFPNSGPAVYTGYYEPGKTIELKDAGGVVGLKISCASDDVLQASTTGAGTTGTPGTPANVAMSLAIKVDVQHQNTQAADIPPYVIPGRTGAGTGGLTGKVEYTVGGFAISIDWSQMVNAQNTTYGVEKQGVGKVKNEDAQEHLIGYLVLAKFPNADGLMQAGSSNFSETANSGEPELAIAGTNGTGNTKAGMLEMSNVDISQEFTDMITTQRGFQANSRIITVSDEMLAELVNLKR